jgi:hypothetical protein
VKDISHCNISTQIHQNYRCNIAIFFICVCKFWIFKGTNLYVQIEF